MPSSYRVQTNYAVPLWAYVEEYLEENDIKLEEFALAMDIPSAEVLSIVDKKTPITEDEAQMLFRGTTVPAKFWLALDRKYWEDATRLKFTEKELFPKENFI